MLVALQHRVVETVEIDDVSQDEVSVLRVGQLKADGQRELFVLVVAFCTVLVPWLDSLTLLIGPPRLVSG